VLGLTRGIQALFSTWDILNGNRKEDMGDGSDGNTNSKEIPEKQYGNFPKI
jgi:hypothetical protein